MIVTKKRFRQEVERRAREIFQREMSSTKIRECEARIDKLGARIRRLEEAQNCQRGSIKGFYVDKAGGVTLYGKEEE